MFDGFVYFEFCWYFAWLRKSSSGSDSGSGTDSGSDDGSDSVPDQKRTQWYIEGVRVCRQAFLKIMGLSPQRLVRTRHTFRGQDMRKFGQPGPDWHRSCMDGMFKGLNKTIHFIHAKSMGVKNITS